MDRSKTVVKNWRAMLRQVYQLKIWQSMLMLILLSVLLYYLSYLDSNNQLPIGLTWLGSWPLQALADACFTAAIVGLTFEWFVRRESTGELDEIIQQKLDLNYGRLLEEIPKLLITDRDLIQKVLRESDLDEILLSSLQIKLGDAQLGQDILNGIILNLFVNREWRANLTYKVTLSSITDEDVVEAVRDDYFQAFVDYRYDVKLHFEEFVFTCVSTIEEHQSANRHPNEVRWLFELTKQFPVIDTSVFDIEFIRVDDLSLNLERDQTSGKLKIIGHHRALADKLGKAVTVHYRYWLKLQKRGHLFSVNMAHPSKKVSIEFDYAKTDIHYVNAMSFFVSGRSPVITYAPERGRHHRIGIELDDWALPRGGVIFVWVLNGEIPGL